MSTVQEPRRHRGYAGCGHRNAAASGVIEKGGLRVSVQPGGCSGFKDGLRIEDRPRMTTRRRRDWISNVLFIFLHLAAS